MSIYALLSRSAGFSVYNQPLQWGFFKRMTGYYDQDADAPASEKKPLGYYDAWYSATGGLGPSNLFVEDGTFTKLREVSLSYRVEPGPDGLDPGSARFSGIELSLSGRNLFTWTTTGVRPRGGSAPVVTRVPPRSPGWTGTSTRTSGPGPQPSGSSSKEPIQ